MFKNCAKGEDDKKKVSQLYSQTCVKRSPAISFPYKMSLVRMHLYW